MKKILINGQSLSEKNPGGVAYYTYHLVSYIANSQPKFSIDVVFEPPISKSFEESLNLLQTQKKITLSPISLKYLWTQLGLAFYTFLHINNILFSTVHTLPLISNPFTKKVLTVHDVGFEKYHSLVDAGLNSASLKRAVKLAHKIIAVSEYTKSRLIELLKVNPDKIEVIYEGVDVERYNDAKNDTVRVEEVKTKYKLANYILFVGTIQPRKNLKNQFLAFSKFNSEASRLEDIDFVVAGANGWQFEDILEYPEQINIKERVKFLGRVEDSDLPYLIAGAKFLSFVSFEEGFGLPMLNAFSSGVPVVTSNTSALAEIGAGVAVLVSPENIDQIADAYRTVYFNEILRADLIDKGLKKAQMFTWDKAAQHTIEFFNSLI